MAPLLSHFLLKQRLAAAAPYVRGDVLDLGCGDGELTTVLQPNQAYVGVDWRPDVLERLGGRFPQYQFYQRDFDAQPLDLARRFDTVVLLAVIEHLQAPERLFGQLPGLLRPGGQVVMTSPSGLGNRVHQWGARLGLFWRVAADEHNIIFSKASLNAYVRPHGMMLAHYRQFVLGGNQLFVCRLAPGAAAEA